MEDFDALWDDTIEDDFVHLVEQKWSKDMFLSQALIILGEEWEEMGKEILEAEPNQKDKERLIKIFNKYLG